MDFYLILSVVCIIAAYLYQIVRGRTSGCLMTIISSFAGGYIGTVFGLEYWQGMVLEGIVDVAIFLVFHRTRALLS